MKLEIIIKEGGSGNVPFTVWKEEHPKIGEAMYLPGLNPRILLRVRDVIWQAVDGAEVKVYVICAVENFKGF